MEPHALLDRCLAKPGAVEDFPFGPETTVCKVAGKVFALWTREAVPPEVSLKCDPDLALHLRATYPAVRCGYHLNKRHWNTVTLDGSVPDEEVVEMVDQSYDLVVAALPRAVRASLSKGGG